MRLSDVPGLTQLTLALAMTATFLPTAGAQEAIERRVNELLAQMTLEEKVGQLNLVSHGPPLRWEDISEGKAGALLNFNSAPDVARAQALARQSRLKIPPLFGLDVLHGFRTQFPLPLGEAAAFSPRISRLASEWAAKEAAYVGVNWTFAPMADLSRDSRWGRIVEGFGEDPTSRRRSHRGPRRRLPQGRPRRRGEAFRGLWRAPGRTRLRHHLHSPRGNVRHLSAAVPRRGGGRHGELHGRLQRAQRRALDGQSLASDRCAAQAMGLRRLRHLRLGRHRRTHQPRHRGGRRRGRAQGDPRRRRHGHDGPALHQAPARRGARRPGAGKRDRRVGPPRAAHQVPHGPVRPPGHRSVPSRQRLPVAGIAPGRPRGGARNLRAAAEPRRRAADPVERPLHCGGRPPRRRAPRPDGPARGARAQGGQRLDPRGHPPPCAGRRHCRAPCSGLRPVLPQHGAACRRPSTRRSNRIS